MAILLKHNFYHLVYMITTYNRLSFLKKTIETWDATRNKLYHWTLIVADDGSTDGTLEYLHNLNIKDVDLFVVENQRRGVHHQTNSLIKLALQMDFDFGFKSDDDLLFLAPGWDTRYFKAAQATRFWHLVYYDRTWGQRYKEVRQPVYKGNTLENYISPTRIQGALWTFNKQMLQAVGFFDTNKFNLCGYGHVDYSLRCCRLGYNDINNPYDVKGSNDLIRLNQSNYFSNNRFGGTWNTHAIIQQKKATLLENRTFIPYNQMDCNLLREKIQHYDISFIIPLRGREDMIAGLEDNLQKMFSDYTYEIIYVNQADNKLFKRGQLCNIGFRESRGDIVIFQDVDIRHLRGLNFKALIKEYQSPFVAFDKISQLVSDNNLSIIETRPRLAGWGACAVFTREQFLCAGGFSNLIIGYGAEDNVMQIRANFVRHYQDLGHIQHSKVAESVDLKQARWYQNNCYFLKTEQTRDKLKDGVLQTIYTKNIYKKSDHVDIINVSQITVCQEYIYRELYNRAVQEDQSEGA